VTAAYRTQGRRYPHRRPTEDGHEVVSAYDVWRYAPNEEPRQIGYVYQRQHGWSWIGRNMAHELIVSAVHADTRAEAVRLLGERQEGGRS
jgi:hypothetical protein